MSLVFVRNAAAFGMSDFRDAIVVFNLILLVRPAGFLVRMCRKRRCKL